MSKMFVRSASISSAASGGWSLEFELNGVGQQVLLDTRTLIGGSAGSYSQLVVREELEKVTALLMKHSDPILVAKYMKEIE